MDSVLENLRSFLSAQSSYLIKLVTVIDWIRYFSTDFHAMQLNKPVFYGREALEIA